MAATMAPGITLIVGLGNPGTEYADTRHNAGFRFIEALLADSNTTLRNERQFSARLGRIQVAERELWLMMPTTFMNHSGEAVANFARYYNVITSYSIHYTKLYDKLQWRRTTTANDHGYRC